MKLLFENWRKFLEEEKINEATDEEIETIKDLLDVPVEKMPFNNIFGDKYRIIEPLKILAPDSIYTSGMNALKTMGWEVQEPSDIKYDDKGRISGKVLCTKTKVTYYIDKSGEVQKVQKSVSLNLPKLLAGIINFIENSWKPLFERHWSLIQKLVKNLKAEPQPDEKYSLPADIWNKPVNKQDFMSLIKYANTANYWIGLKPDDNAFMDEKRMGVYQDRKTGRRINYEKFKNFANYVGDKFQEFLKDSSSLYENYYIIYSRHPIDVLRMGDHQSINLAEPSKSHCHRLPSMKDGTWDEYNICALAEAHGNGMIAYVVPEGEFANKGIDPNQGEIEELNNEEIFDDPERGIDGLVPATRVRIKNVSYHPEPDSDPIRLAVPEQSKYGISIPLLELELKMFLTTQNQILIP